MRLELIGAFARHSISDALSALRRLADEDRDGKVRAGAVTRVAALGKMLENAADIL
jgi:hypothetical protein